MLQSRAISIRETQKGSRDSPDGDPRSRSCASASRARRAFRATPCPLHYRTLSISATARMTSRRETVPCLLRNISAFKPGRCRCRPSMLRVTRFGFAASFGTYRQTESVGHKGRHSKRRIAPLPLLARAAFLEAAGCCGWLLDGGGAVARTETRAESLPLCTKDRESVRQAVKARAASQCNGYRRTWPSSSPSASR